MRAAKDPNVGSHVLMLIFRKEREISLFKKVTRKHLNSDFGSKIATQTG